jgi:sulfur carrier protein
MIVVNNRDKIEWFEGMTVQDILDKMGYSYVLITVMINDKFVPQDEYHSAFVEDGAKVNVFHLAHGG